MKKVTLLSNLVNSLTKNEKGYFIRSLSKKDVSYGKLFKLISTQKIYDEKKLKAEFAGTYIGNNFPFAKNYLYHSILKNLIQYGANKKDAYYYFSSIKLLYQKGLYKNCAKMLKQIVKLSKENNDYLSVLRAIQYIKLLRHSNVYFDDELMRILNDETSILENQSIVSTFQSILADVKGLRVRVGGLKGGTSEGRLEHIRNHPYILNPSKRINKYCEQMYHEILFLIGFLTQDSELSKKHIAPLQKMMVDTDYSENFNDYRKIDILKQIIRHTTLMGSYRKAEENIETLKYLLLESKDINQSEMVSAFAFIYTFQTDLLLNQRKLDQTKSVFEEVDDFTLKYRNIIPDEFFVVISANIIVLRFMRGDYKLVSHLLNQLFTEQNKVIRRDVFLSAMLTDIAVSYELKSFDLCESRLNTFNRYIQKHKIKEPILIHYSMFFNKLLKGEEIKPLAIALSNKIDKLKKTRISLNIEFISYWVKEKICTSASPT